MSRGQSENLSSPGLINLFRNPCLKDIPQSPTPHLEEFSVSEGTNTWLVEQGGWRGIAAEGSSSSSDSALRMKLEALDLIGGQTYTFSAVIEVPVALTGFLTGRSRRIVAEWPDPDSDSGRGLAQSEAAPNVPGETRLSVTFTMPANVTEASVSLVVGAASGHGSVVWSRFSVTETRMLHDFFDGDTEPSGRHTYAWMGAPRQSASVQRSAVDSASCASEERLEASADQVDVVDIRALLDVAPHFKDGGVGRYASGVLAEDSGDAVRARRLYREAMDREPALWGPRYRLAVGALARNRANRAIRLLEPVAHDSRTPEWLLNRLAARLKRSGRRAESEQWGRWAVERDPRARGLDLDRMAAASASRLSSRAYLATMLRARLDEVRERAAASMAESVARPTDGDDKIFVFWAQGIDNAPPVVQACHRQLLSIHPEGSVVTLALDDVAELVDMPAATTLRVEGNLIKFSNTLRLELLKKFGGYWIDATCWVSQPLTSLEPHRAESDFFAYQLNDLRMSSWFLTATRTSYIVHMMSAAQDIYWESHDYLVQYFVFHSLFEALGMLDPEFGRWLDRVDHLSASAPHELQRRMFDDYDPAVAERIKTSSVMHKLTYKFEREIAPNSNVAAILRGDF